jgi:hypothetical protein
LSESHLLGFNHIYALSLHSIRHNYLHNYDVFSIYYKKLSYWTGGCFSIRLRRFVCRLRRISTSTSTNFNSTSTNFNSTSTNLYSTLTIFSQFRRIWIETDIWTYDNDICVVEMICTCS